MSKKLLIPDISDEEKALFREAMRFVKPLHADSKKQNRVIHTPKPIVKRTNTFSITQTPPIQSFSSQPPVSGGDALSFCRTGLQNKKFTQLKQGKHQIEATLDLHEHTADAALIATDAFLSRAQRQQCRSVCIIHGKGLYSANNQPVLKNLLNNYLRNHPTVLAFHSAKNRDGGTGAVYVLLKTKHNPL